MQDIGATDAIEDIEKNRLLTPANKQQDIVFYEDQRGERLGSMSGNDKVFTAKKKQQVARVEKKRFKRGRFTTYEPSSSDSKPQTSAVADTSTEEETKKESGPEDPDLDETMGHGRYTPKDPYVTLQLPRRILLEPAVKELADRLRISNNELSVIGLRLS